MRIIRNLLVLTLVLGIVATVIVSAVPPLRERAESIPLRIETWWHDLQPRDPFVPPPRDDVAVAPPSVSATPTATPGTPAPATATPTPAIQVPPPPPDVRLTTFKHEYQGWNNCGPATVGMLLSHFGYTETQKEIAPLLKPNPQDRNVSPDELAGYVRTKPGMGAVLRVGGTITALKQYLANGMPVIVEMWFTPKPNDGMGHYRLLFAYNDRVQQFNALDSYSGANVKLDYAEFLANWKAFNNLSIAAYAREQEPLAMAIAGPADEAMWRGSLGRAVSATALGADDAFAWFNLGASLQALGRPGEAVPAFDRARRIGLPWRMLWYQYGIYDAYLAAGRVQDVLDLTELTLTQTTDIEEVQYYRGRAFEMLGRRSEAMQSYREAVRLNRNFALAADALARVSR
ncbi:MAG: C39 family peptidase [Chloroflexi bacterium]|nr:C39 family peptidase [Chloroflexota bacterium]